MVFWYFILCKWVTGVYLLLQNSKVRVFGKKGEKRRFLVNTFTTTNNYLEKAASFAAPVCASANETSKINVLVLANSRFKTSRATGILSSHERALRLGIQSSVSSSPHCAPGAYICVSSMITFRQCSHEWPEWCEGQKSIFSARLVNLDRLLLLKWKKGNL